MKDLLIERLQNMLETWPYLRELGTNVPKKTWDDLEEFSDLELLNTLERFARHSYVRNLSDET